MNKTTSVYIIGLLSSALPLLGQFQPMTENDYAQLITDRGWDGPLSFAPVDSSFQMGFDTAGSMNIGFIQGTPGSWTNFGIQWGAPIPFSSAAPEASPENQELFRAAQHPTPGNFVSVPLDGADSFDFWVSTEPYSRSNSYYSVWSLFHPDSSTSHLIHSGFTEPVNGQDYYVFSFQDGTSRSSDESLRFFVNFSAADGSPFDGGFTPVPEPATYGLLGSLLLAGLIGRRRFRRQK